MLVTSVVSAWRRRRQRGWAGGGREGTLSGSQSPRHSASGCYDTTQRMTLEPNTRMHKALHSLGNLFCSLVHHWDVLPTLSPKQGTVMRRVWMNTTQLPLVWTSTRQFTWVNWNAAKIQLIYSFLKSLKHVFWNLEPLWQTLHLHTNSKVSPSPSDKPSQNVCKRKHFE